MIISARGGGGGGGGGGCIPLAVEACGCWGAEAQCNISRLHPVWPSSCGAANQLPSPLSTRDLI